MAEVLSCPWQCFQIYLRERRELDRTLAQGFCGIYKSGPELTIICGGLDLEIKVIIPGRPTMVVSIMWHWKDTLLIQKVLHGGF